MRKQILFCLFAVLLSTGCRKQHIDNAPVSGIRDLKEIKSTDTLKVATMYGSVSYFLFRDDRMGFDYEMAQNLANYLQLNMKIYIAKTESEMFNLLRERKVDVIAYNVTETQKLKQQFSFVLPQSPSYQVLVQNMNTNLISDVTQLEDDSICVRSNSIFYHRLKALNDEIGGSIRIVTVPDSVSDEDLIDMVAENKIKYTLAYHDLAMLHKSYYRELDCRMPVGFAQKNGWLIRNESKNLKRVIEQWAALPDIQQLQQDFREKYWDESPYFALRRVTIPKGAISPFDRFFRKYAPNINWDWRMLAAVAFHESRFDAREISWAGAAGLMQLMPHTASNFGLNRRTVFDPEKNIEAGVQYIKSLNMTFRQVPDQNERVKFILAAYNSGPAHVLDAMALARKYGKNPGLWFNHVEYFLLKNNEPKYYNDPVVKYGSYSGKSTAKYVKSTLSTFEKYKRYKK